MGALLPAGFDQQMPLRIDSQIPLEGEGIPELSGRRIPQVPEVDIVVGGVPGKAQVCEAVKIHIPEIQGVKLALCTEAQRRGVGRRRGDLGGGIGVEGTGLGQCVRGRDGLEQAGPLQNPDLTVIKRLPGCVTVFPAALQLYGHFPAVRQGKCFPVGEEVVGL